jgi:hypothetical protein
MQINIKFLILYMVIAVIISIGFSIFKNESLNQFILRFSFVGFIDIIIFLTFTYFKIIK